MSLGPVNLSPIISGYVADKYGWRTNFWIMTAFTVTALLLIFFTAPETSFKRPAIYETDINSRDDLPSTERDLTADDNKPAMETREDISARSYWQDLLPISGLQTRHNPLVLLGRLFTCGLYPAVIWSFLVGGTYVAWVSL